MNDHNSSLPKSSGQSKKTFEAKTLTQLGILGIGLKACVSYLDSEFEKMGMDALLTKLPILKTLTPFKSQTRSMDIDLSCVVLDKSGYVLDTIWYGNLRNDNESLRHTGDGLSGAKNFAESLINQEEIHVRLHELSNNAHHVLFFISSYHHHDLCHAKKGMGELMDNEGILIHKFLFDGLSKKGRAVIAWHIKRQGDDFLIDAPLMPIEIPKTDPDNFSQAIIECAKHYVLNL